MVTNTATDEHTDIEETDRVFVRAQGADLERTRTVDEVYDGPHIKTYVVDFDGSGDAHVSRDRLLSATETNNVFHTDN
ncbi:hypothetical protein [Haloarcula sp. K1]|uniref:hypothetical protein n=1 Tax=Haloarcula sp. K1 TaxID=1622207 RepID=UPI0012BAB297|nr:hypothetical protein [Haloarcula sp. K1]